MRAKYPERRAAENQPHIYGLTSPINGAAAVRFNADGNDNVVVPGGQAVAAATATAGGGVVLAVTGVDAASAQAAAAAFAADDPFVIGACLVVACLLLLIAPGPRRLFATIAISTGVAVALLNPFVST